MGKEGLILVSEAIQYVLLQGPFRDAAVKLSLPDLSIDEVLKINAALWQADEEDLVRRYSIFGGDGRVLFEQQEKDALQNLPCI